MGLVFLVVLMVNVEMQQVATKAYFVGTMEKCAEAIKEVPKSSGGTVIDAWCKDMGEKGKDV